MRLVEGRAAHDRLYDEYGIRHVSKIERNWQSPTNAPKANPLLG